MDIVFTPAGVLEILNQIDELKDYGLSLTETLDGNLQLQIGDSTYEIDTEDIQEVSAPEEVVDDVNDVNEEAYTDLVDGGEFESYNTEAIEAGLIKEAIKSMLLGGAIKFIKKLL